MGLNDFYQIFKLIKMSNEAFENNKTADFAFLDSGTGGIPYMLALKEKQKSAKCVYLGDTLHFPYGEKSKEEIIDCSSKAVSLIQKKWNPKTLIIACNTISVTALDELRRIFPELPIVGTVPAIKLAAKITRNKNIGFLATNASINSPYSEKLIKDFAGDCTVYKRGDPELISFIEKDFFTASQEEKEKAVLPAVDFFVKHGCDTIILGCTHFTHISTVMQKVAGQNVKIIDSRDGVSNQAIRVETLAKKSDAYNFEKDFEPFEDMTFFCTKASKIEKDEYKALCKKLNIPWGGVVSIK